MSGTGQNTMHVATLNVAVVPMNYAGEVLLIREGARLALPAGVIADGETPEDAARRILQAATGFKAEALFPLEARSPGADSVKQEVRLFLARNLEPARSMTDTIYQGTTERVSLDDIDALSETGRLSDPVTVKGLFVARAAITGHSHTDHEGAGDG